ncbi:hypothetical protein OCD79_13765 [Bacillus wiedmannii]|nr:MULTISPECIES: hypothetical protein [Bacillus cereus group]MCU5111474.1 hypothetical protein [Bacillus wiedmannii]MCU5152288.1 hypothetical protein [Bacillus wiedmannii]
MNYNRKLIELKEEYRLGHASNLVMAELKVKEIGSIINIRPEMKV